MKGTFKVDPEQCHYGAATGAIRRILSDWMAIDWFVPPGDAWTVQRAAGLFREHHASARAQAPELFPPSIDVRVVVGDWSDFADLVARVSATTRTWDWKFGALKRLSQQHAKAHAWSLDDERTSLVSTTQPGPGDIFFRAGNIIFWNRPDPEIDWRACLSAAGAEVASWYLGHATIDLTMCLQWQLAEKSERLQGNPFVPLLRSYAAGFYPFGLAQDFVVLFAFAH